MANDASLYEAIQTFTTDNGVVAVVTQRVVGNAPRFTFMLGREFDQGGKVKRTSWLDRRHIDAARELLDKVEEFLDNQEDVARAGRRRMAR